MVNNKTIGYLCLGTIGLIVVPWKSDVLRTSIFFGQNKVNKLFFFFSSRYFLNEIKKNVSVFLSNFRNTRESLGELEKAVEILG